MANVVNNKYSEIGEYEFDNLIVGEKVAVIPKGVTLAAAQGVLLRGTLLGVVTASKLAVLCDSAAADGSNVPMYILAETKDTGEAGASLNVPALSYQSGMFNRLAVITKDGQDISSFEEQLREKNILFSESIPYPLV